MQLWKNKAYGYLKWFDLEICKDRKEIMLLGRMFVIIGIEEIFTKERIEEMQDTPMNHQDFVIYGQTYSNS